MVGLLGCFFFSFPWQLVIAFCGKAMKPILVKDTEWKPLRPGDVNAANFGASQAGTAPQATEAVIVPVEEHGTTPDVASTTDAEKRDRVEEEAKMREFSRQGSRVMEKNKALASPQVLMSSRPGSTRTDR